MTFENICGIIDLKDNQVKAYIDVCLQQREKDERISIELIQTLATSYAQNLAKTFMENNRVFLSEQDNRLSIRKYLASRGADKGHSGNRFSEELYKVLEETVYDMLDNAEEKGHLDISAVRKLTENGIPILDICRDKSVFDAIRFCFEKWLNSL